MTHRNTFQFILRFLVPLAIAALMAGFGCTSSYVEEDGYEDAAEMDEPYLPEPRDLFRDLEFYGMWHWVDPFGWVWRPTVVLEWRPFFNGNWVWTEFGWTWVSYEPFGWATCHYGFWANDFALGWVWIPAYDWEPARVDWFLFDDYIAWSPVPFEGFYWAEPWDHSNVEAWVVVPMDKFADPSVGRYHERVRFRAHTVSIEEAPDMRLIGERSRRGITPMRIEVYYLTYGDVSLQRITLPTEVQTEVDEQVARRKVAFKKEYNNRNGYDPRDPPPESDWHKDAKKRREPKDTRKKDSNKGREDKGNVEDGESADDPERGSRKTKTNTKESTEKETEKEGGRSTHGAS